MESSDSVFRDPKYYLSNVSAPDIAHLNRYSSPRSFSAQVVLDDRGRQSKYKLSNASTETIPSIYSDKEFQVEQTKVIVTPSKEQIFPEGGLAGWGTALGA